MVNPKKKILIIEDEKPLAHALELKLTKYGFDVHCAANGEDAVGDLERGGFALIVCDLVMPKMDGFQVLSVIKEKKIQTPIIVLTNLSQPQDEQRARELGANGFFVKADTPIVTIVETIKKMVG
ncbi:response regulator [Candidatus Campbellbacteria bacterium]|nr:MAG: response regulator [Candidatus Campbellbacteria bacterium]